MRPRPDRYRTEAAIVPSRARGMMTPDEVVVIYYDSPKQGARFRANNKDVLKMIGQFNKKHLAATSYYAGGSTR